MSELKTKEAVIRLYGVGIIIEDSDMNSVDFSGEKLPSVPGHEIFSLKKAKENVKMILKIEPDQPTGKEMMEKLLLLCCETYFSNEKGRLSRVALFK